MGEEFEEKEFIEWMKLMMEAKESGLTIEEIRAFFNMNDK
ncbi:anti-repressor SinI family protein [Lederbergia ruris]